jgi:hypothetical protein
MSLIQIPTAKVLPEAGAGIRPESVGATARMAARAQGEMWQAVGQIGTKIAGHIEKHLAAKKELEDRQHKFDATNAAIDLDLKRQEWASTQARRTDLHEPDNRGGTGFDHVEADTAAEYEKLTEETLQRIHPDLRDDYAVTLRLKNREGVALLSNRMIDVRQAYNLTQIKKKVFTLAYGDPEKGIPADPRGALQAGVDYLSNVPSALQPEHMRSVLQDVVRGTAQADADAAAPILEENKKYLDADTYDSLDNYIKGQRREQTTQRVAQGIEEVRQVAMGVPEQGIPGDVGGALLALDSTAERLPKELQTQFKQEGAKAIAQARLADNAQEALDFIKKHPSRFEPTDRINLTNAAEHALSRLGGSTSQASMAAQVKLLERINDPQAYSEALGQVQGNLSQQARIEMARRFSMRDNVTETDPQVLAETILQLGDYYITGDALAFQREAADARFGNVRRHLSDLEEMDAEATSKRAAPALSKDDYVALQALARAKVPPQQAVALREGLLQIQRQLGDENGKMEDPDVARAVLLASGNLIAKLAQEGQGNLSAEQVYGLATELATQLRPEPVVEEIVSKKPGFVKWLQERKTPQGWVGTVEEHAAYNRAAGPLGAFSAQMQQETILPLEGMLATEAERQEVRDLRRKGMKNPQIIEKLAPKWFPSDFWDEVKGDGPLRKKLFDALGRGVSPAEIMLNAYQEVQ